MRRPSLRMVPQDQPDPTSPTDPAQAGIARLSPAHQRFLSALDDVSVENAGPLAAMLPVVTRMIRQLPEAELKKMAGYMRNLFDEVLKEPDAV